MLGGEMLWSENEFKSISLKDKRLEARVKKVAEASMNMPEMPINQANQDWAATKAAYRLFANNRLTTEDIFKPHRERTLERIEQQEVVLAIQDKTFIDYSSHKKTKGLGPIGDSRWKTLGLVLHSTFVVTPEKLPLGLLTEEIWARDGFSQIPRGARRKVPIENKESYCWIKALRKAAEIKNTKVITICDRESDIYEFFQEAQELETLFVVRAAWNRHLESNEEYPRLWDYIEGLKSFGKISVEVPEADKRRARTALIDIKFGKFTLGTPQRWRREGKKALEPICLEAVYLIEQTPPEGEKPLEWMLLTNIAVTTLEEALEIVEYYKCRWSIETFHKILKSGCTVEKCRLQTAERLKKYITLMSVVAWRIFWMTHLKRTAPQAPATVILTTKEIEILTALQRKNITLPVEQLSVAQAVTAIAKLGGFLARKNDGKPGSTVIWRGWTVLQNALLIGKLIFP
jgi:Transposase DNA-binding/Transposase DDE domain